jgi:tyrosine decarboxylase / aspartate 1-decarboxylase
MFFRESDILKKLIENLNNGFSTLPEFNDKNNFGDFNKILLELSEKLKDNYPYFHPLYAGQMLKPPHEIARLAYSLAMFINPNNHALDGGKATSQMEKEAVSEIAKMFGWENYLGHLTGGGTIANLEALWIAGEINPEKLIVASSQAHYTHKRLTKVLKLPFEEIDVDNFGRMDLNYLESILKKGNVGTVVVTIGTTAFGSVDNLKDILLLKEKYGFRIHADAAYGGYFILADNLREETKNNYLLLNEVDSIVIDPHKHGLQPYGCGCVLFKDSNIGKFYKHDSPYTYFTSDELHLGEISLECSRPGASAAALWATIKYLPLIKNGEFSSQLENCRNAALIFYNLIKNDNRWIVSFEPELDIVTWLPNEDSIENINRISHKIFEEAAKFNLHLAIANLPTKFYNIKLNTSISVTALRSVFMKPEHNNWIEEIYKILTEVYDKVKK